MPVVPRGPAGTVIHIRVRDGFLPRFLARVERVMVGVISFWSENVTIF